MTAIPLVRRLPGASSNLPERPIGTDPEHEAPRRSYSVLLPVWFAVPAALPKPRCALTAPFHPYPGGSLRRGGLFSVALSLSGKPARRTLSGTVGPWSPDFPLRPPFGIGAERPSGRLTTKEWGRRTAPSSSSRGRVTDPRPRCSRCSISWAGRRAHATCFWCGSRLRSCALSRGSWTC
jgi:hypothetical protein